MPVRRLAVPTSRQHCLGGLVQLMMTLVLRGTTDPLCLRPRPDHSNGWSRMCSPAMTRLRRGPWVLLSESLCLTVQAAQDAQWYE
jgi:hypothetical protein